MICRKCPGRTCRMAGKQERVPHSSAIGPFLLLLFINDLPSVSFFANDIKMVQSSHYNVWKWSVPINPIKRNSFQPAFGDSIQTSNVVNDMGVPVILYPLQ